MPKLDLVNALQIKSATGEVLQLKGPGFSWTRPAQVTWTNIVPQNGGPAGAASAFFRGNVTPDGSNYRVTTAAGSTNGRALVDMPVLAEGTQIVLQSSLQFNDATRLICRQVENNDSTGGVTLFDVLRANVGPTYAEERQFGVISNRRFLHYIGVTATGQYFTINGTTRYRVL